MNQPDAKTAANTLAPAPATIPVETLIQSMKPEKPLVIEGATGDFGAASSSPSVAAVVAVARRCRYRRLVLSEEGRRWPGAGIREPSNESDQLD